MLDIIQVHKDIAYKYIYKYHYSKVMPRLTKKYLLIKEGDNNVGVVTLGWGTQPLQTIRKIFSNHKLESKDYYEIGKMCFKPEYNNGNYGSMICSAIIRRMKKNTEAMFLYTLADGIMGKAGYVYQASNFKYIGMFWTSVYYDNSTGEKIHPRTAKKLCLENAKFKNKEKIFWLTYDFMEYKGIKKIDGKMFRYVYPLNKKAKKILASYNYDYKNPKDSDLVWYRNKGGGNKEVIDMPKFNMDIESGYNSKNIKQNIQTQPDLFSKAS